MTLLIAYDSETTGLVDWFSPSSAPQQPHIVQLAALLVDAESREEVGECNLIVKPDGWEIPPEVSEVHGITTEQALEVGIPEHDALNIFMEMHEKAHRRIAHNETFDARIIRIALKRFQSDEAADHWKAGPIDGKECTARMATPIMKLAPTERMVAAGRHHPKTPKLEEAYEFFTGKKLEGAHDAMADVRGCLAVYWAIVDGKGATGKDPHGKPKEPEVAAAVASLADSDVPFL